MVRNNTPETLAAIQARLAHLRKRKRAIDQLIRSLERYSIYDVPVVKPATPYCCSSCRRQRLAGAA